MKYINEPIEINHVSIHNRLVMPPMATSSSEDGSVNEKLVHYYDEKSAGGYIGLIITEHSYINQQGIANPGQVSISRNSDIEGLKKLVEVIHKNGSKVLAQISHAGSAASQKVTGMPIVSASAVVNVGKVARYGEIPEAMTLAQIEAVVDDFAMAAKRAKEAGFDGVEIHSAHGYFLNQFYSPLTNKRTDQYTGETLEGRLRIHQDVIRKVREMVGDDYLVAVRLGGCDYLEGGSTKEDAIAAAVMLEGFGIDLLDISGGLNGYILPANNEPGYYTDLTEAIKKKVSIPVIMTGGVTDIADAERFLETGKADLIGVGRSIFKDSKWAEKNMK